MTPREDSTWIAAIGNALRSDPGLETWEGHFDHRLQELREVSGYWPDGNVGRALEIGCGNGLAAIYFSPRAGRIVASDLAFEDVQAHSIGLEFAKAFVERMGVMNVELLGCSAEELPLPDSSFEFAYGIYCLEHIPNRPKALRELHRVLKPGGRVLLTVPAPGWALLNPFYFYYGLFSRIFGRILRKLNPPAAGGAAGGGPTASSTVKITSAATFRKYYPNFPFPEPHGTFPSWSAEFLYYRAGNWKRLLEEAGFRQVRVEPVSFLPHAIKVFLPLSVQERIEMRLRKIKELTAFAQFFCLLGERD